MVTLQMMQFTAVVLMLLLTVKLLFLRERRIKSRQARQARWLMAGGTALMVPVAIFGSGPGMLTVAFAVYFSLLYLVDSFCFYLTSPAPERMQDCCNPLPHRTSASHAIA